MQVKHFLTAAAFAAFCVPSHGAEVTKAVLGNIEATGNVVTDVSFTGLASESFVNGKKWDWATQVTNKPGYVQKSGDTMTGNLTLDNEDPFVKVFKTGGKYDYYTTVKAGQLINSDSEHYTATLTLPIVSGTLALLSDVPSVSGLASKTYVDSHKWDWSTQVTNAPNFATLDALDGYVATNHSGNVDIHGTVRLSYESGATPSLAIGNAGDHVYANSSASLALGANSIVENAYGGMALGIYAHTTNQFAFVYGGDYTASKYYGDHGGGTFNVNPLGGLSGFWIGETNLATYLENAGSGEHTHSNLVNGASKLKLSPNGVVSVGTDQSALGNPVITIHAGSVFSADTAAHGKTFSTDLVLDYTYIDGVSGPLLIQTNGWVFVDTGSTLWCGPQSWPSYAFDLNNYDSESPTATLSSTDSDPSCSFSGTITITRPRGKIIPTIDHVLPGETIFKGSYNEFETKGFAGYAFKGPYPYDTTMLTLNMAAIEFFDGSVGIMNPTHGGADGSHMWGIGQFWKNGYQYSLPYTDNNGSGSYILATTSMTNGLASTAWVNAHQWTWASITNKPTNVSAFNNDAGYVTANHTHSNLVNGTTQVIANQNGTASIVSAQSVQKPNCVRVSRADGPVTMVLSFRNTSDELESWGSSWPDQLEFTIEYDGVSYDAITVGESDSEGLREVSTSLSWANGSRIFPAGIYYSSTYGTSWSGVLYDFESPRGLDIIGDGNGESCSTYTYIGETSINKTIATTDQIPAVPTLATVATTGSYNDLLNKPTIPAAQIQSDWNQTNTSAKDYIKNKPDIDSKLATKEDSILYTYDKTTTLPDGNHPAYVKAFSGNTVEYNSRLSGNVVIPPYKQTTDAFYEVCGISGYEDAPYGADALLSVTAPTNVMSIGEGAFYECYSLEFLELPGVTSIAAEAFKGCYSLKYIDFGAKARSSVPTLGTDAFISVPTSCKIIVPDSQLNAWKAATGWSALVTAGYQFMKHSDWEYVRRYELPTVPTNVSDFTNDANYVSASTATNIARAIISDALANVNVNIQSAEDTRVALTNLITILKSL